MKILFSSLLILIASTGCISPSIPKDYAGPTAVLKDSFQMHGFSKSDFFMVSKINGKRVETSEARTRRVNYGKGMSMYPEAIEHTIPTGALELEITAQTAYAAPILALVGKNYEVRGIVRIDVVAGNRYLIKWVL